MVATLRFLVTDAKIYQLRDISQQIRPYFSELINN